MQIDDALNAQTDGHQYKQDILIEPLKTVDVPERLVFVDPEKGPDIYVGVFQRVGVDMVGVVVLLDPFEAGTHGTIVDEGQESRTACRRVTGLVGNESQLGFGHADGDDIEQVVRLDRAHQAKRGDRTPESGV